MELEGIIILFDILKDFLENILFSYVMFKKVYIVFVYLDVYIVV